MIQNPPFLAVIFLAMVVSCAGLLLIAPPQAQAYEYKVTLWSYDMKTDLTDATSISMDELSQGFWVEHYYDGSADPVHAYLDGAVGGNVCTYINLYDMSTSKMFDFKFKGDDYIYPDSETSNLEGIAHSRVLIVPTKSALHSLTSKSQIEIVSGPGYYYCTKNGKIASSITGDVSIWATWSLSDSEDSDGDQSGTGSGGQGTGNTAAGTGKDEGSGGSDSGIGTNSTEGSGSTEANRTAKGVKDSGLDTTQSVDVVQSSGGSGGTKASSKSGSGAAATKASSKSALDIIGTLVPNSSISSTQEQGGTSSDVLLNQTLTLVGWPLAYLIMTILFIAALPFGLGRRLALIRWGARRSSRLRL